MLLPTVTDNSGNFFFVTSTNNPNDFFNVGSNLVTYTYRDAANNVNICSFTVLITTAGKPNIVVIDAAGWVYVREQMTEFVVISPMLNSKSFLCNSQLTGHHR